MRCVDCHFWTAEQGITGKCRESPMMRYKIADDWCGRFKEKVNASAHAQKPSGQTRNQSRNR